MISKPRKDTNRRNFILSLGCGSVAALAGFPAHSKSRIAEDEAPGIIKCKPYLQAPNPDSMTIRWITHLPCYSWVAYGETPDRLDREVNAVDDGLVRANDTVHGFTLSGLRPGTRYYYRAMSRVIADFHPYQLKYGENHSSEVFSFSTPDPKQEEVEFLVFNDIHDRPESFPVLLQYQGESKKDFVFLNGDMFNWQDDEDQIVDHLLKPLCESFASNTPFIFSRGNHETRGKFARQLGDYFDGGEQKYYYSFQRGPLYAIVLDSGEDKEDAHPEYGGLVSFDAYRLRQKAWLEKEIRKDAFRRAKYKVVFSHIPLYHAGSAHGTLHCREHWGPLLNKAKIDLLISGHTHRYGIHPPVQGEHDYPIVIGGGKKDGTRTIMNVKVTENSLRLTMVDDSGVNVGTLGL